MRRTVTKSIVLGIFTLTAVAWSASAASAGMLVSFWLPFAEPGAPGIYHRDENTGLAKSFPNDTASFLPLSNATGVMVGPNGLIYAAASSETNSTANTIFTYDPLAADVAATKTDFLAGVTNPAERPGIAHDLIFDREGNLYVSNWSLGTIKKYDSSGAYVSTHSADLGVVSGMAFLADGSGKMVAAANDAHYLIDTDGSASLFSQSTPTKSSIAGFQGGAVAMDSQGNVLLSNSANFHAPGFETEAVARFDAGGNFLHDVIPSDGGNTTGGGTARIFGVLEGPENDIFIASLQAGAVNWAGRFDSGGLSPTSAAGRPSFGGRDFDTGSNAMGRQIRYLWLWDEGDSETYGHSDPTTKAYVDVAPIPEPASWTLLAIGAIALEFRRRSRKR